MKNPCYLLKRMCLLGKMSLSRFNIDFPASIPIDWITIGMRRLNGEEEDPQASGGKVLRFLRLLRFAKMTRILRVGKLLSLVLLWLRTDSCPNCLTPIQFSFFSRDFFWSSDIKHNLLCFCARCFNEVGTNGKMKRRIKIEKWKHPSRTVRRGKSHRLALSENLLQWSQCCLKMLPWDASYYQLCYLSCSWPVLFWCRSF